MKKIKHIYIIAVAAITLFGCKKKDEVFEDPYAGGNPPLGVTLSTSAPNPASGAVGTEVTFQATGLMQYKDKLKFMFNGEVGEITEVTDSYVKVKVPAFGSSGVTSLSVDDRLVIGPQFKVNGFISFDPSFRATAGANGEVSKVYTLVDGRNIVLGGFTNFDNKGVINPLNRIVRTTAEFEYDRSFRTRKGANGYLSDMIELGNRFIIAGGFGGYDQRTENISNITALTNTGAVDTIGIQVYKRPATPKDSSDTLKYFPKFNGGTNSFISHVYKHQNKILAVGNFRYYVRRRYGKPTYDFSKDSVILDSTEIRQVLRMNADGSLDTTWRFNLSTHKGLPAGNGSVNSIVHTEGALADRIVLFGSFTTFDQKPAGRIVRLKADGTVDNTFNTGTGADDGIGFVTYNGVTKKYLVTGSFRHYNGKAVNGIMLLNEDGTLDESFKNKVYDNYINTSRQLSDGLIVISGSFKRYDGVSRNGFAILKPDGSLAPGYNSTGPFSGYLNDIIETKTADNKRALLLIGSFYRFDNVNTNNITRITLE